MKSRISLIAGIGKNTRALGKDNDLLFKISEDMKRFRRLTKGHPVIMGRKTWESLPKEFRPLPGRANFVVTRTHDYEAPGAYVALSLVDALTGASLADGADEIFIIGGGEIYREALPLVHRLYLTLVHDETIGDTFFPEYPEFTNVIEKQEFLEHVPPYEFVTLER
jgi:dihydrofolate reductase